MTDAEWEERQKARQEEIQACSEALAILSSDDAHDTFTKTFNFVQVRRTQEYSKRDAASKVLFTAAKTYANPQLATLATQVRLDAFTKVKAAIDEMVTALLKEKENADFQLTIADQRETQKLLTNALNVLKAVYAKKSFAQTKAKQEPAGPPPPPGFKKYEQSSGAGGVMGMIQQIIADAKQLEADAIKAETEAQKAYETVVKDTNASIEEKNRDITNKSAEKADAEADKTASEEAKETAMNEQQQNKNEEADLHKSCDFVLKNFDIRQAARDQEVEALRQAKAILSGASFTAFLQKRA